MKNNYREVKTVAVVGAGGMGEGIALNFAQAGLTVHVITRSESTMNKCLAQIEDYLQLFDDMQLLQEKPSIIRSRIRSFFMSDLQNAVKDCDFVIESVPEILDAKKELYAKLDSCDPGVIISSNTSSFPINLLAEGMKTPARVIGTHYFMPAHIIPLVEIHWGDNTDREAIEATKKLMLKVGKKPILVNKSLTGFVVNRIQAAIAREANYLIEQGVVSVEDFDLASRSSYGFRLANLGPLAQADVNGLDTILRGNTGIFKSLCNSTEVSDIVKDKVAKGELGLKSGKGYYDYSGQPRQEIMAKIQANLLKQLVLFNQRESKY